MTDPIISPAVLGLLNVLKEVSSLKAVQGRLLNQPGPASDALAVALGELSKIYTAVQAELDRYLTLWFDPSSPRDYHRDVATLASLKSTAMKARLEEARGHCHKISNIYCTYLNGWFSAVLDSEGQDQMRFLFGSLADSDFSMLGAIDSLSNSLSLEAAETLDLVEAGITTEANARVSEARKTLLPIIAQMGDLLADLQRMRYEFIRVTGVP